MKMIVHKQDGPLIIESVRGCSAFWLRCDDCRHVTAFDSLSAARDAFDSHDHSEDAP